MFNVMIVDDERRTRQGIATLVDWNMLGYKVIETAADGYEALKKQEKYSFDLIIIDIRMPKMSGIEVIKTIREQDSSVQFLILSGYAEFEYAKQALPYNVAGYLLKPVEEEELIRYLKTIYTELKEEELTANQKMKSKQEEVSQYLKLALEGEVPNKVESYFRDLWKENYYAILLLKFFDKNQLDLADVFHLVIQKTTIKNSIAFIHEGYIGLLVRENKSGSNTENAFRPIYNHLKELEITFIGAVSRPVEKIASLRDIYGQAVTLIQDYFLYEEDYLITPFSANMKERSIDKSVGEMSYYKDTLFFAVEISDTSTIKQLILELVVELAKSNDTEQEIKQQVAGILTYINHQLLAHYPQEKYKITKMLADIADIHHCHNVKQLINITVDHFTQLASVIDRDDSAFIVKKMIHFIERNYDKAIKLDTMAELLHYHKVYLGKIFKETTGEYFKTYLDKVRINNSKRLLLEGFKIYEIAEMVGYTNADYFHSKFKKYEGISPSVFRKQKR